MGPGIWPVAAIIGGTFGLACGVAFGFARAFTERDHSTDRLWAGVLGGVIAGLPMFMVPPEVHALGLSTQAVALAMVMALLYPARTKRAG